MIKRNEPTESPLVWWRIEAESKLVVAKRPRAKGDRLEGMAYFACDLAPKSAGLATSGCRWKVYRVSSRYFRDGSAGCENVVQWVGCL
jgi:hypothetical protein